MKTLVRAGFHAGETGAASEDHAPLSVLNHAGHGIRTMITCSCGQMPAEPASGMSVMHNGHMAHRRDLGLPPADYTLTRFGEGPWAGLTWDEWYAGHGGTGTDPYTGAPSGATYAR